VTEDDARDWVQHTYDVSRETMDKLEALAAGIREENCRQNLISANSASEIWSRHLADSAQLLSHADASDAQSWLDLGSGAGFPGLVLAILRTAPITLVEERRLRADFLIDIAHRLNLGHVSVQASRLQAMAPAKFDLITARAFAPLPKLFDIAHRFTRDDTVWLLPKGQSATTELESIRQTWHGVFHVKQSVTNPDAAIIVATQVRRAGVS